MKSTGSICHTTTIEVVLHFTNEKPINVCNKNNLVFQNTKPVIKKLPPWYSTYVLFYKEIIKLPCPFV